jgi:hypothetical protein
LDRRQLALQIVHTEYETVHQLSIANERRRKLGVVMAREAVLPFVAHARSSVHLVPENEWD